MINYNQLLKKWEIAISCAQNGFRVEMALGGLIERRATGWFIQRTWSDKPFRATEREVAISCAAAQFARIKRTRQVLPLP